MGVFHRFCGAISRLTRRHQRRFPRSGLEKLVYPGVRYIAAVNGTEDRLPKAMEAFRAALPEYATTDDLRPAIAAAERVLAP
jgi:hypothetical protein